MVVHVGGRGPGHIARVQGGFDLSSLFTNASGFDFTDLDVTKTWGAKSEVLLWNTVGAPYAAATASGQSVQKFLDKSQGVTGAELLTNGALTSATGWSTQNASITVTGGEFRVASLDGAAVGGAYQQPGYVNGKQYRLKATSVSGTSASPRVRAGTSSPVGAEYVSVAPGASPQVIGGDFSATSTGGYASLVDAATAAGDYAAFTAASLFEIPGNHASQSTSSARPTWQANSGRPYLSFDGSDDGLLTTLVPAASMTLAVCFRWSAGTDVIMGSVSGAGNDRCFLSTDGATGKLTGGWGAQSGSTITGGSALGATDHVGLLRANGSTVELWLDGNRIYQGSPSGSPNTTVALGIGARNNAGTLDLFMPGRIYGAVAVQQFIPDAQVLPLMRALGALAGLSF